MDFVVGRAEVPHEFAWGCFEFLFLPSLLRLLFARHVRIHEDGAPQPLRLALLRWDHALLFVPTRARGGVENDLWKHAHITL